ncbi:hypothetical protein CY34DRAFT_800866 [Suillus luteus UH-Slu-Lm8-n1]|uniref:Uncharacterized protein n=1 Tax=Suillus luteus UH-Slu-Lm8-n1 TaxID=930992 RepID=A0A0D0B8L3_9AGAM|nr:hypothetical protein CY34DRAFT_800866 [Suillus luteus UH-Slu-Lm8-n1]
MDIDILALDRQEVVNDLVHRLGSLSLFLDGINDLMKFIHLEDHELLRYSRKVLPLPSNVLLQARARLRREGIALYLFVLCSEEHLKYKSAYFQLLTCIRRRRPAFSADVGDRIASLLSALESNFTIRCGGVDTRAQLGIEELLVPKNPLAAFKSNIQTAVHVSSAQESHAASNIMLRSPRPRRPFVRTKRYIPDEKQPVPEELSDDSWTNSLPGYSSIFEHMDPFSIPDDPPSLVATQLVFEV